MFDAEGGGAFLTPFVRHREDILLVDLADDHLLGWREEDVSGVVALAVRREHPAFGDLESDAFEVRDRFSPGKLQHHLAEFVAGHFLAA